MTNIYSTEDYSNWPEWMLRWRIAVLQKDLSIVNKKIEEETNIQEKVLKEHNRKRTSYEKHKHLFD